MFACDGVRREMPNASAVAFIFCAFVRKPKCRFRQTCIMLSGSCHYGVIVMHPVIAGSGSALKGQNCLGAPVTCNGHLRTSEWHAADMVQQPGTGFVGTNRAGWIVYWVTFGLMAGSAVIFAGLTFMKPQRHRKHGCKCTCRIHSSADVFAAA